MTLSHLGLTPERVRQLLPSPTARHRIEDRQLTQRHPSMLAICRELFLKYPTVNNVYLADMIQRDYPEYAGCSPTWVRQMVKRSRGYVRRRRRNKSA